MTNLEAAEVIARMLYNEDRKYAFTKEEMMALEWAIRTMRKIAKQVGDLEK